MKYGKYDLFLQILRGQVVPGVPGFHFTLDSLQLTLVRERLGKTLRYLFSQVSPASRHPTQAGTALDLNLMMLHRAFSLHFGLVQPSTGRIALLCDLKAEEVEEI